MSTYSRHYATYDSETGQWSAALCGWPASNITSNPKWVTCRACRELLDLREEAQQHGTDDQAT